MNKIISKENQKKLIIMIVIIMLFNFVMPNYSFALRGGGGEIFKYFAPIALMIPDLILNKLQNIFIGKDTKGKDIEIAQEDPEGGVSHYLIMYSPGVIFSGQVAGLDVNFMSPLTTEGYSEGHVVYKVNTYDYGEEIETLPDGTKRKGKFDKDDLEKYYGFNEENATKNVSNSDTETWIVWFRKRGY